MRTLLLVTAIGSSCGWLGCGGGSGKGQDSAAGGAGGVAQSSGGTATSGAGGSTAAGGTSGIADRDASIGGTADASRGACQQAASAPCGGDLVGRWTLKFDECVFPSNSAYCPGLAYSVAPSSSYGIGYTFDADRTFSASVAGTFIATLRYPPECLNGDAGPAQSCAQLSSTLEAVSQQSADAGTDSISSASFACSAEPTGTCACDETVTYTPRTMTGSYTTSGTKIVVTSAGFGGSDAGLDGGTSAPTDYCVSGNTLTIWPTSSSSNSKPSVYTR